jgi:MFS family permease
MGQCWLTNFDAKVTTYFMRTDIDNTTGTNQCYCETINLQLDPSNYTDSQPSTDFKTFKSECGIPCAGNDIPHGNQDEFSTWYCGGYDKTDRTEYTVVSGYTCPPQTIQMRFRQKGLTYTNLMNLTLYSVYSYPNAVLALLGGMLVDRIGLRPSTIIFLSLICTGELLFCIGILNEKYWLMVLGRVVFGFGGESLTVSQSAYCARWFKKTGYLAMAFGITLSFSRIGSSTTFLLVPWLAANKGLAWAVWVGAGACAVSLFCAAVLACLDFIAEKKRPGMFETEENAGDPFKLADLKNFGLEMWLITGICVFYYITVFPFNGIAQLFFHNKYHVDLVTAGAWVSIYTFTSAGGSPIIGLIVDRAGRPLLFMTLGTVLVIGVYILFWLTMIPAQALMVGFGLSITLLGASMWPAVPYVVPSRVIGSAYGLMTSVQNLGLAIVPQILGTIRDKTENQGLQSFYYCFFMMLGLATVALALCILLGVVDTARGGVLLCSGTERKIRMERREAEDFAEKSVNP